MTTKPGSAIQARRLTYGGAKRLVQLNSNAVMQQQQQPTEPPYTELDHEQIKVVTDWLALHELSRAWLAKNIKQHSSTVSTVLNGKYPSSPSEILAKMLAVIDVEDARIADGAKVFVEGSVYKLLRVVFERTRKHANFGVITGVVGVGKTAAARHYADRLPQTLFIESEPRMKPAALMNEILRALEIKEPEKLEDKFRAVLAAMVGAPFLLIVDEAEALTPNSLHYLRRVRDKANVGVVLMGTPSLTDLLKAHNGQFDQIRSRVSMWPKTITGITRDDMDEMARAALQAAGEVPDDVLDALWAYSGGSARVLMESLLPGLRDFVVGKKPLTGPLVDSVAANVLNLKKVVQ